MLKPTSDPRRGLFFIAFLFCLSVQVTGQSGAIFDKYLWLSDLIDPASCENGNITEYDLGPYAFLLLETPEGTELYFENGSLFCTNTINFDCLEAYGLEDLIAGNIDLPGIGRIQPAQEGFGE